MHEKPPKSLSCEGELPTRKLYVSTRERLLGSLAPLSHLVGCGDAARQLVLSDEDEPAAVEDEPMMAAD